ncbi:hypothetical protein OE88DRAFT_1091650 [Heliocybe sulcata]|uniref:Uncharacterized protein n=1 Tax=Heliocybe sulcata TaxID=5364 RepID=A0A5C3MM41_9AGAM|nr:hypothetical protein OE88DRAFT_1091650 [Heliocybe sulcata]
MESQIGTECGCIKDSFLCDACAAAGNMHTKLLSLATILIISVISRAQTNTTCAQCPESLNYQGTTLNLANEFVDPEETPTQFCGYVATHNAGVQAFCIYNNTNGNIVDGDSICPKEVPTGGCWSALVGHGSI